MPFLCGMANRVGVVGFRPTTQNPQSRGLPTWFIVPEIYVEAVLGTRRPNQLTLARNFLPKPKR
jgi:hypothetical protein